jgi:hypothetical protein
MCKNNATFPHYTVQNCEVRAHEARMLAAFEMITYAPIVSDEERWINFSNNTRGWLDESKFLYYLLQPGQNRSSEPKNPPLPSVVWTYDIQNQIFLKGVSNENVLRHT